MQILVVAVGRVRERGVREAIDEYVSRIRRYARFEEVELRDASEDELEARFARAVPERSHVVILDGRRDAMTSEGFARFLARVQEEGVTTSCF